MYQLSRGRRRQEGRSGTVPLDYTWTCEVPDTVTLGHLAYEYVGCAGFWYTYEVTHIVNLTENSNRTNPRYPVCQQED